ncbi:MAG: hypothetical protein ACRENI_14270 [Gemmatimonadaceae bacterium]
MLELPEIALYLVECGSESGRGYKQRIVTRNEGWFGADQRKLLESELATMLQREWDSALSAVGGLLDSEPDNGAAGSGAVLGD